MYSQFAYSKPKFHDKDKVLGASVHYTVIYRFFFKVNLLHSLLFKTE